LGSDSNPGTYSSPWATIQYALDSVTGNDTYSVLIKVAQGTYNENISVTLPMSKILIQGGWSSDFSTRTTAPSITVIDGNEAGHVINISADIKGDINDVMIEGFTITGSGVTESGIRCNNCQGVTIRNNRIIDNGNSTTSNGISLFGESTVLIEQNIISGNTSSGIYLRGESHATIQNNIIVNNLDTGIYRAYGNTTSYIVNNVIDRNGTKSGGRSGIMTFSNDVITNNIIVNNGSKNNPNAGLSVGIYVVSGATPSITYNNVYNNFEGGYTNFLPDGTNMAHDPLFISLYCDIDNDQYYSTEHSDNEYYLDPSSPLIDAGTNNNAPLFDFEDKIRPFDGNNDMVAITDIGVYEYDGLGYVNMGCQLNTGTDCDDNDPDRFPGNPEVCDGKDNDCDGDEDNGLTDCFMEILNNEGFENNVIPTDWTIIDNAGTSAVWRFDNPGNRLNLTGGTGGFAIADSDYFGVVDMDTELLTPEINTLNLDNLILEFRTDFYYFSSEVADVDVSINSTAGPWLNIWRMTGADYRGPRDEALDISELAAGHRDVVFRFHYYNASYDWWWQIDDVRVIGTECTNPDIRIGDVSPAYYSSIQDAYIAAGDGDTIKIRHAIYDDSPVFNEDKSVILEGGYDCDFINNTGETILSGTFTVSNGAITVKNIILGL
jgi:parallel beta-helix repeat protein